MVSISEAQIIAWVSPIFLVFIRILAVFSIAPIFSIKNIPNKVKILLAFLLSMTMQFDNNLTINFNDSHILGYIIQQIIIGLSIGLTARLILSAIELTGELIGLHIGLNFASFFDPLNNSQINALTRFLFQSFNLLFLTLNGHLFLILGVYKSFKVFPINYNFINNIFQLKVFELATNIFESALYMSLPVLTILLFVNIIMGITSRIAPQMNIFAIGFPITIIVGLITLIISLSNIDQIFIKLLETLIS